MAPGRAVFLRVAMSVIHPWGWQPRNLSASLLFSGSLKSVLAVATFVSHGLTLSAVANANAAEPNQHLQLSQTLQLPGRGGAVAWNPAGTKVAAGGHFRPSIGNGMRGGKTALRYDTRVCDLATGSCNKSYACHSFWVTAVTWADIPSYLRTDSDPERRLPAELIAEGGGDHAAKVWNTGARGSLDCPLLNPWDLAPYRLEDGALQSIHDLAGGRKTPGLGSINGWITGIEFSPDRRYLAGVSRDGMIRVWQVAPGRNQWRVVRAWMNRPGVNLLSVNWRSDGRALVTSDRGGRVAVWSFNPAQQPSGDLWDDSSVDQFAKKSHDLAGASSQFTWLKQNPTQGDKAPLWFHELSKPKIRKGAIAGYSPIKSAAWNARFSPDGARVAATRDNGTVTVYNASASGFVDAEQRKLAEIKLPLPPRKKKISANGLDWSPGSGQHIAVGSGDGNVYVYKASDYSLFDTLVSHKDLVTAVRWSADGSKLASTAGGPLLSVGLHESVDGPDTTVKIWSWR